MPYTPVPVGPESGPEPPFPYRMEGKVISGFGRGSKELGIPTANLPVDHSATPWIQNVPSGVYFGYAALDHHPRPFPMVMSIGYNPFYKNSVRSAEVHLLHAFEDDFYGAHMRLLILGFIREERDYPSVKDLVEDINSDCESARISLARPGWSLQSVDAAWGEKRE